MSFHSAVLMVDDPTRPWAPERADRSTGRLVIAGTDGIAGHLRAWDAASGDLRWEFAAGDGIYADPVVVGERVLAVTIDSGELVALDLATGAEAWRFPPGEPLDPDLRAWTSPVAHDGLVLFPALDGILHAVDPETGEEAWRFDAGASILSVSRVTDRVLYLTTDDHELLRVDLDRREITARRPTGDLRRRAPIVSAHGVLVHEQWMEVGGELLSLDPDLGGVRWSQASPDTTFWSTARPYVWEPAGIGWEPASIGDGPEQVVLVGNSAGEVHGFDEATGTPWLVHDIGVGTVRTIAVRDSVMVVGTIEGRLVAAKIASASQE